MSTKGNARTRAGKKARPKQERGKIAKSKSKSQEKGAIVLSKLRQRSAKFGGPVVVVQGRSGKYKVYGGKGGRVPTIGSRATASGIAGRLGVKREMFREVDRLIDSLRLRKKTG